MTTTPNPSPAWKDETARNLAAIVNDLSRVIDAEPDHGKRHKLKDARELVRDVMWGTDAPDPDSAPLPEVFRGSWLDDLVPASALGTRRARAALVGVLAGRVERMKKTA